MKNMKKIIAVALALVICTQFVPLAENDTFKSEISDRKQTQVHDQNEEPDRESDQDHDGILDTAEVELGIDPVSYDSDEDGLSDGDEILLGLNPLEAKTDGTTLDSERIFHQTLDEEKISEKLLAEDNQAVPSLELDINGNINKKVSITETSAVEFSDSRAIIGEAVEIDGKNISSGTLSFTLDEESTSFIIDEESMESYNANLICKYNEDGSTEYLETIYDEESNLLSAEITSEGTYFVLDVDTLINEVAMSSVAKSAEGSYQALGQADVIFVIDTTGSMGDEITNVKESSSFFVDTLKNKGVSAQFALVTYEDIDFDGYESTKVHKNGNENWFLDMEAYKETLSNLPLGRGGDLPECVVDGLETARLLDMRASAGKVFILLTDAPPKADNRYGIPSLEAEIELLKNEGVSCYVISSEEDKEFYSSLYETTNGSWADIDSNYSNVFQKIAAEISSEIVGDGYWIYLQGPVPVPVRLDTIPTEGSTVDTDQDGIADIYELKSIHPTEELDLDALITQVSHGAITGTNYGVVKVYCYNSNPTALDTDFDGTNDPDDSAPNNNHGTGVMHYSNDGSKYTCNIEFNMDYRNLITGDNQYYIKDVGMLTSLLAADVYENSYIQVTDFARIGGSDIGMNFGNILGLKDSEYINIRGKDYSVDQDDTTDFYVGHRNVIYNGKSHEVIVVSVRGTNGTHEEWTSNFDIGADTAEYYSATGTSHPHWRNKDHHKGFDVAANRVLERLLAYIETYVNPYSEKSILITGHSRGAAIANILGAHFEDDAAYRSYTYTYATPSTTTASNASSYRTIFNVLNTDDLITYIPLESWGFSKYGQSTAICVEDYYENELGAAEEGSWEWFMGGLDYNNDYNTQNTLKAVAKIADNREDMYVLGTTDSEKVWEDDLGHTTRAGAEEELATLSAKLEDEKLLKFCNMYIVYSWFIYHVEINYCPAYLLQTLANMTTGVGPLLGRDVAGVYADAKTSFVASSGKVIIGGMTHPHMPTTYYIMTYHNLESLY